MSDFELQGSASAPGAFPQAASKSTSATAPAPDPIPQQRRQELNDYWERVRERPSVAPELWSAPPNSGPSKGPAKIDRDLALAAPNEIILRANLPKDIETKVQRYAEYFGVPPTHFGIINGEIMRWVPERNAYAPVVPTIRDAQDIGGKLRGVSSQWSQAIPDLATMAATTATGLALSEASPLVSVPAAAAVSGFTDWARQALDKALAGEPTVPEFLGGRGEYDYGRIGEAAIDGAVEGMLHVGVHKVFAHAASGIGTIDRTMATDPVMQAQWVALWEEAQRRGITLTQGQTSNLRRLLATERELGARPGTLDLIYDAHTGRWLPASPLPASVRNPAVGNP
jgi:hypothetical protein